MNWQHIFTFLAIGFGTLTSLTFLIALATFNVNGNLKWFWVPTFLLIITLICGSLAARL